VNAVAWAQTALAGDYLAEYDDEPRDDDYGSRCGFDVAKAARDVAELDAAAEHVAAAGAVAS
jgi:hypothetical protein